MSLSLTISIIGYFLLGLVAVLDKFILSKTSNSPRVYTFYSTIFFLGAFALVPWTVSISYTHVVPILISGLAFGFGIWTMFKGLEQGETTHIMPFLGVCVTIASFILSFFFLNEVLSTRVEAGLLFLVVAGVFLSFEKSLKHQGFHVGFMWALVSGVLFGISHVASKYVYDLYPFITSLVWTKGAVGLVGIFILCLPKTYKELKRKPQDKEEIKPKNISIIIFDKIFGIVGVILIQYAIFGGSVTIVNALSGLQYVFMFGFIYFLTKYKPSLLSEYFTKKEIETEVFAIVLVIIGLFFIA